MRILYLSQLIPYPPDAGPKVRIYHVLQYLATAGHDVTLVAFRREADQAEHLDHLRRYCGDIHTVLMPRSRLRDAWHLGGSLARRQPFLIGRDHAPAMHRLLRSLLAVRPFDAVHADQLWMAQYALAARDYAGNSRPQTVLDQHNAVYLIPQRLAAGTANPLKRAVLSLEARKMARYEVETCRRFDHVVWVTNEDRQAVAAASSGAPPVGPIIPICVDPLEKPVIVRREGAQRVTFLGGLHWPPNAEGIEWFARQVWPQVRRQAPDAVLTVIGKSPPEGLLVAGIDNLEITGYVPDPTPYLAETAAFIVPLHAGGGMRVKILDAWSWGLPTVSTTIGAEGLRYRDGENLLTADSPADFAAAVVRLLRQPELAARLGAAGRQTVATDYDWRVRYKAWDYLYPTG